MLKTERDLRNVLMADWKIVFSKTIWIAVTCGNGKNRKCTRSFGVGREISTWNIK